MNFKPKYTNKLLLLFFLILSTFSFSQEDESEIKKKAEKLFKSSNYVEAGKLYEKLLAYNPRDFYYNYKYGICLIYNSESKGDAIKYLKYTTQDLLFDSEAYFYLGKAYHLNYEFSNALKNYQEYSKRLGEKNDKTLDVNRNIEMAKNGEKLLTSADEILVVDKKEIEKDKFFRSYDLKDIGGNILVSAQFQSKIDKKKNHIPVIYFASNPNIVYYSSYGENENTGKDIYYRTKKPDGTWSDPLLVKGGVNTKYDDDFPFFHTETGYLYFSSKGHNSMGGYDIFRCMFYPISKEFGPAENIDFPISSPDDDLFYVVDSMERNAYFASSRQSVDGKIHVYNVKVKKVPIQFVVAKAKFSSITNPNLKNVVIEIYDVTSDKSISKNKSNETGAIFLTFPKSGNYEYRITIEGIDQVFKIPVNIPVRDGLTPIGQQIVHEKLENGDDVKILNTEGQDAEELVETMAEIARIRSQLKPNVDQFDLEIIDNSAKNQAVYASIGYVNLTDREVQEKIEELAINQEKQFKNLKDLKQKALDDVVKNSNDSKRLQEDLRKIVEISNTKSGAEKRELIEKGGAIVNELRRLDEENRSLVPFADSLTSTIELKEKDMLNAQRISNEIKSAFDAKNTDLMVEKIKTNSIIIKEIQKVNSDLATEGIIRDIVEKKEDIAKITKEQDELTTQKENLKAEIYELKNKSLKAKSKEKNEINKQIANKEKEIDMIDEEIKSLEPKLVSIKANLDIQERKLIFIQSIQNSTEPLLNTTLAEAKAKSQNIENQKAKELIQYIEDQSKELAIDMTAQKLDKKSPELSPNVGKEDLTYEQKKIVNEVAPDHSEKVESIKNDKSISNEEKHKLVLKEGKNAKFEVAKEIFDTEEALKNDPYNEKLQSKLKELNSINESLRENIDTLHKEYVSNYVDPSLKYSVKESQLINRVKPNHFAELKAIESNPEFSEKKKITESQKVDHDFVRNLTFEKIKLESQVKKSPNNPDNSKIKQELVSLKKVAKDTDLRIEARNKKLATLTEYGDKKEPMISEEILAEEVTTSSQNSIENTDTKIENTNSQSSSKSVLDDITSKIYPDYQKNVKEIKYNNSFSAKQKEENIIKEEDKLIKAVDLEIIANQDALKTNAENKEILEKIENLNTIKQQSEDRKKESEQAVISNIKSELQQANLLGEVDPAYESEASNLTISKRKTELISREEKLQNNLQARIDKNNSNPTINNNLNLIAENQVLNDLIDASKSRVFTLNESSNNVAEKGNKSTSDASINTKNGDQLDNSNKNMNTNIGANANEKKVELLNSLDPTYLADVSSLTESKSIPDIISREEKLQTTLKARISQNNKVKGNSKLTEENKVLNELIAESKTRVELIKGSNTNTAVINSNKENITSVNNNKSTKSVDESNINTNKTAKSNSEPNIGVDANEKKVELLTAVDPNYITDVTKLVEAKSTNDIVAREEKLQTYLKARITQNNKIKGNQKLIDENKILNELIQESKSRVDIVKGADGLDGSKSNSVESNEKTNEVVNKTIAESNVDNTKNENNIASSLNNNQSAENNNSANDTNNSTNLNLDKNSTTPTPYTSPVDPSVSKNKSDSLERIRNSVASDEIDLIQKLNNPDLKKSERKVIAKELVEVQNEHNSILEKSNQEKLQLISDARQGAIIGNSELEFSINESANLSQSKIDQLEKRNEELKKQLSEIKDDRKKVLILTEIRENNQKLSKLYTEVLNAKKLFKDATILKELEPSLPAVSLISKETLYEYKSKVKSDLDSLVSEVAYSNQNLENANIENKDSIIAQIKELQGMLVVKTNEYKAIDQELRNRSNAPERTTVGTKNVEISMEDMNQITSLANYDAIKSSYEQKKVAEQSKEDKFKVFEQARDSYAEAVKKQNANPEIKNDEEVAILFEDLKAKTKDYSDALRRYQEMINAYKLLIQDKGDSAKIEQVINGAKPVDFNTVFSDYSWQIAKDAESFKLLDSKISVPAKDRILPNDKIPTGLIYRVQVGALRKPLDENSFKEFSPITAEPLPNGISRYITGFFSTSQMASDVKNQIRQLGYKDAFVVAYCDGVRIPVEKAIAMQNNNLCVPIKDFDKSVSLKSGSASTAAPTSTNSVKVNETKPVEKANTSTDFQSNEINSTLQLNEVKGAKVIDFTKYPEAVLGQSIDTMQGLFYTIQIGAFNRPANSNELKNIDNILYQLLEDGKIRYTTGIFNSVIEALPAKKDAIAKGVPDAFVTVYFKGKRITFQEAGELLEREGVNILQKK